MPKVYLDTDVAFDIISKRTPHFEVSVKLLELVIKDKIALLIGECSLSNLIYLSYDIYKIEGAASNLNDFIGACRVISGGNKLMNLALNSQFSDKKYALQYYTAIHNGADYFITRNIKDYKKTNDNLPVLTPIEFLQSF
ncbi:type II toxin-antitoxin system VapC family toxin [Shivajiella indica]|uniref:Type II toxin-antitoxin system VapC family toxin n=1 Tax=Shivajiella indica TaxID=872115 RepID=A0ABW5BD08_9BACT